MGGVDRHNVRTGWVSICVGEQWRIVCDSGWDINDARVVCQQLGFPTEGMLAHFKHYTVRHDFLIGTGFCGDSCYDGNRNLPGATNFRCTGNEEGLFACSYTNLTNTYNGWKPETCSQYAGVICSKLNYQYFILRPCKND